MVKHARDPRYHFQKHHADDLVARRELAGLSQSELARRAGISQPTLWKIENGKFRPTAKVLGAIARVFGVPATDLMPRVEWVAQGTGEQKSGFPPLHRVAVTDDGTATLLFESQVQAER